MCACVCVWVCAFVCVCVCVCVCACVHACVCDNNYICQCFLNLTKQAWSNMSGSNVCISMAPLDACQACSPTEDLHTSWVEPSFKCAWTRKWKQKRSLWYLASWSVRPLLDVEGSVKTARQSCETGEAEDWTIEQVVSEVGRYVVVTDALPETKWFGEDVYHVGGNIVLAAGRPVPGDGQARKRGQGVALVLADPAVKVWKRGGSHRKVWGSRLVIRSYS